MSKHEYRIHLPICSYIFRNIYIYYKFHNVACRVCSNLKRTFTIPLNTHFPNSIRFSNPSQSIRLIATEICLFSRSTSLRLHFRSSRSFNKKCHKKPNKQKHTKGTKKQGIVSYLVCCRQTRDLTDKRIAMPDVLFCYKTDEKLLTIGRTRFASPFTLWCRLWSGDCKR